MTKISTLLQFRAAIENINAFKYKDGVLTERRLLSRGGNADRLVLVVEDLRKIDRRLPGLITALLEPRPQTLTENSNDYQVVYTNPIKDTLAFWNNPRWLKTVDGQMAAYRLFISFEDVNLAAVPQVIEIFAWNRSLGAYALEDGEEILYARGTVPERFSVCPDWLAYTYPNWVRRYENALALGYDGPDLVYLSLAGCDPTPPTDLPEDLL